MLRILCITCLAVLLSGCAGVPVNDYAERQPTFDPHYFFNGPLEAQGERHFQGRAGDVKGSAEMRYAGNAVSMNYRLQVTLSNGRSITVNMNDWLYQVDADTLINVTGMSKFGFDVGQVVLTMRKL